MDGIHHAVHHEQRLVGGGNRTGTADTYRRRRAGGSVGGHELGSRDASLEGVVHGHRRGLQHVAHLHARHRAGEIAFLDRTVADDHRLFEQIGIRLHRDDQVRGVLQRDFLVGETETVHREYGALGGGDGEVAVDVGDDAFGEVIPGGDDGSDDRNAVGIQHDALDLEILRLREGADECPDKQ